MSEAWYGRVVKKLKIALAVLLGLATVLVADRLTVTTLHGDDHDHGDDDDNDDGNDDGCVHARRLPRAVHDETPHTFAARNARARSTPSDPPPRRCPSVLLWLLAVIIAIVGVVQLFQGQVLLAIALFVIACLVGPGGYSVFRSNKT